MTRLLRGAAAYAGILLWMVVCTVSGSGAMSVLSDRDPGDLPFLVQALGFVWILGLFGGGIYVLDALGESRRKNRLLREALIALSEQVPGGRLGSEEEIEWWLLEARAQRRAS
jgi:hypothetical protein